MIAEKQALRRAMLAARESWRPEAGEALAHHVLDECSFAPQAIVAGFWPMGQEIDIRPLLHALDDLGHAVALPETPARGHPLLFRRWRPGCTMVAERYGSMRPDGDLIVPDVLLVPLLAFDGAGRRLGYGGGYYDRTMGALPGARRIGCAYAAQQVETVPDEPHDVRLQAVATERGVIRCEG